MMDDVYIPFTGLCADIWQYRYAMYHLTISAPFSMRVYSRFQFENRISKCRARSDPLFFHFMSVRSFSTPFTNRYTRD